MKKICVLLLLLLTASTSQASHFMGGEMRVERQPNGDYKAIMEIYRDARTTVSNLAPGESISIWKKNVSTGTWDLHANTAINKVSQTVILPGILEVGRYEGLLPNTTGSTFPAGSYRISYRSAARNDLMNNLPNTGSAWLALYTTLEVPATPQANTNPQFLAPVVFSAEAGVPFQYNPIPFDQDGDSVSWSMSTPADNVSPEGIISPCAMWTALPAGPTGAPGINAVTGAFIWTPPVQGRFQQAFTLKSYRNGVALDSQVQDIQFIVLPAAGLPDISTLSAQVQYDTAGGYYYATYEPNAPLSFSLKANNSADTDSTFLTCHSLLFKAGSNAQFTNSRTVATQQTGTFSWTPPAGTTGTKIVVFRGSNFAKGKDFTVVLRKATPSGIATTTIGKTSHFQVSPNPVQGPLRVKIDLPTSAVVEVTVTNMAGQSQMAYRESLSAGTTIWSPEGILPAGIYFISFQEGGRPAGNQVVVIP